MIDRCECCGSWEAMCVSDAAVPGCGCARCARAALDEARDSYEQSRRLLYRELDEARQNYGYSRRLLYRQAVDADALAAFALSTGLAECERLRGEERRLGHLANSLDADLAELRAERDEARSELMEAREIATRNATDCAHLRQSAIALTNERDEARAGLQKDCEAAHLEAYETGLAEAYERAAKVCDSYANEVRWRDNALGAWECASRIRALGSKGGAK